MLKQIEEMEELRIPSIILSTKDDLLLLIGEAKYKAASFQNTVKGFFDAKFWNMFTYRMKFLNCVTST